MKKPNPGSVEALEQGCECPVMDNHYGKGAYNEAGVPQFWTTSGCPVHDPSPLKE